MANTIAALLQGRDNNFNLIRFVAASAVILDHSFALVAPERAAGALVDLEALELARVAVDVFFIVSGFLVTRSVLTQPTLVDYAVARFLRLFPALLATCIFIAFLLGPAVTSVSLIDYFSDPRPWLYVPLTASLVTYTMTLPGVFAHVPEAGLIDPPLWTLRYETACYILLGAFALVGLLATRARASLTLAGIFAAYLFVTFATPWRGEIAAIDSIARFVLCFFVGGAFYLYADKIRLDLRIVVALALGGGAGGWHRGLRSGVHGGARLRRSVVCAGAGRRTPALQSDRRLFLRPLYPLLPHPADFCGVRPCHRPVGVVPVQLPRRARGRDLVMAFHRASGAQAEGLGRRQRGQPVARRPAKTNRSAWPRHGAEGPEPGGLTPRSP